MSLSALVNYLLILSKFKKTCFGETLWLKGHHAAPLVTLFFYYHHVTYRTPCHASGHLVILPWQLRIWESVFYSQAFFTLHSFLLVSRPPWGRQFNLTSCWSSKHSSGPAICLNNSNPQKIYICRFYLRVTPGQSRNIKLCRELVLQNVSFELLASDGIWTLFTDREIC